MGDREAEDDDDDDDDDDGDVAEVAEVEEVEEVAEVEEVVATFVGDVFSARTPPLLMRVWFDFFVMM